jgi:predicted amino acid-binding ACT domain protein/phosphoserine phosphatase
MAAERLFVIYGAGNDSIGLVGKITTPLAEAGGNIVDLRQDVLHGLFTIYLVVDFQAAGVDLEKCRSLVSSIADATSLFLAVDKFTPIPRDPEKTNLLCILVGEDKPGIAAKISAMLSRYRINIEFSKMIAREDIFLMELLVDCRNTSIPLENLQREIESAMAEMKIRAVIQREDVFNKKKRWLVFSLTKNLLPPETAAEIARQTGLDKAAVAKAYGKKELDRAPYKAVSLLGEVSGEAFAAVVAAAGVTAETQELVQTLKTFGYRVAISALAAQQLVERVGKLLGADATCGVPYQVDPDTKRLSAEGAGDDQSRGHDEQGFIRDLADRERLNPEDITVITDTGSEAAVSPGIRLTWNLKTILELYNQRVLSKDNILGLLGCFGIPHA